MHIKLAFLDYIFELKVIAVADLKFRRRNIFKKLYKDKMLTKTIEEKKVTYSAYPIP